MLHTLLTCISLGFSSYICYWLKLGSISSASSLAPPTLHTPSQPLPFWTPSVVGDSYCVEKALLVKQAPVKLSLEQWLSTSLML